MTSLKITKLFLIVLASLAFVGCGSSKNSDSDNNKNNTFFDGEINQNSNLSVLDLLEQDGRFDSFFDISVETNVASTLDRQGPFTIFAFTDNAWENLTRSQRRYLRRNRSALKRVLLYHVVNNQYSISEATNTRTFRTLAGEVVRVRRRGNIRFSRSNVIQYNGFVGNGVVHVIDRVAFPPSLRNKLNSL